MTGYPLPPGGVLDEASGVCYRLDGPADGIPLMITLPLMASFEALFGPELAPVRQGYLDRLCDRYRVLTVDYPSIGGSRDIAPAELSADRVCADLLAVASHAGFARFAYWGHSWGGGVGLQMASRSDRLTALVVGGWPPLGGPYRPLLEAARRKQAAPEASSLKVLRSAAQYAQWVHYTASVLDWPERQAIERLACPRMVVFGSDGDLVEAGLPIPIASTIRQHRDQLVALGWTVHEVPGQGHGLCMQPEQVLPPVRRFLDRTLIEAA